MRRGQIRRTQLPHPPILNGTVNGRAGLQMLTAQLFFPSTISNCNIHRALQQKSTLQSLMSLKALGPEEKLGKPFCIEINFEMQKNCFKYNSNVNVCFSKAKSVELFSAKG